MVELPTDAVQAAFEFLGLVAAIAVAVRMSVVGAQDLVLAGSLLVAALGQSPGAFRIRDNWSRRVELRQTKQQLAPSRLGAFLSLVPPVPVRWARRLACPKSSFHRSHCSSTIVRWQDLCTPPNHPASHLVEPLLQQALLADHSFRTEMTGPIVDLFLGDCWVDSCDSLVLPLQGHQGRMLERPTFPWFPGQGWQQHVTEISSYIKVWSN